MEAHTDTPVTTGALICPICLRLIQSEAPADTVLEFADFPGVTFHTACVGRIGLEPVRQVLAANWPPPPAPYEIPDESPEDGADSFPEAASEPAADESGGDVAA